MKITIISKKPYAELKKLRKNFEISKSGDIFIALGGDGTFMRAAQLTEKPILLIRDEKDGSIGYHSDLKLNDMDFVVKSLKSKNYYIENISNKIELIYKNKHYFAINEARLNNIFEEVSFKIFEINGKRRVRLYPFVMSGDGLLVTGMMGSTAYNKSAGGPIILTPDVMCITFLNPDGPYTNPIIVDGTKEIEVEIVKYQGILGFDNTKISNVKEGDTFRIKLSDKKTNVIRFDGIKESLADKLERKIRSRLVKDFKN
jgi:NAD+ kinase